MLRLTFYSSGGWESSGSGKMAHGGGADLMLRFRLKRGGDGMKYCRKIKREQ
jgi:hypothetical protein